MNTKLFVKFSDGPIIKREISSGTTLSSLTKSIGKHYNMSGEVTILYRQRANHGHQHLTQLDTVRGPRENSGYDLAEDGDYEESLETEFGTNRGKRTRRSEESDTSTLEATKRARLRNAPIIATTCKLDGDMGANTASENSSEKLRSFIAKLHADARRYVHALGDFTASSAGSSHEDSDGSKGDVDDEGPDEGEELHSTLGGTGME